MEAQDQQQDTAAIMRVIAGESAAFWNKDYEAWARHWVHSPTIRLMGWWPAGGVAVVEGWAALSTQIQGLMAANPTPNPTATNVRRERINLRLRGDTAWVTFDQYGSDTGDARMDMPGLSRETRILERHAGEWKIVYVCWLLEGEPTQDDAQA
jgi:hypothetical protein